MSSGHRLTQDERAFFSQVSQAVMANPFSDRRVEIDKEISGFFQGFQPVEEAGGLSVRHQILLETIHEVNRRILAIESSGRGDIQRYSGKDRRIIMTTWLFVFFHHFLLQFDELIRAQLEAGKVSVKVPFAKEMFAFLEKRGFAHEDILHFIALSYQLRRAFYFIDRGLVGRSDAMKRLRESLWNNVFTSDLDLYNDFMWHRMEDFSTLILGETGTGKGTAARAIGMSGFIPFDEKSSTFKESFAKIFLPLNLSQFSENLIESELFGHKKGSFTGAVEDHQGLFDQCSRYGSIFLDEIGEVGIPVQIKLLKTIEERNFNPVGSHEERRFEGRVIAATNQDIGRQIADGSFRSDFFYRLCSDIIVVPPLRERIAEDPLELDDLIEFTLEKITGKKSAELTGTIRKYIIKNPGVGYSWPGNVRELGQCVRRMLLKRSYNVQEMVAGEASRSELSEKIDGGLLTAQEVMSGYCSLLYQRHGTIGEVARITRLDRRTVKKYLEQ